MLILGITSGRDAFPDPEHAHRAPIVGALLLLFVRDDEQNERIRAVALTVSGLVFAETLLLWSRFDAVSPGSSPERHDWIPSFGISYGRRGCISLLLVVLTRF